jgi:hypothetical protein
MRRKIVFQDPQSNLKESMGIEEEECAARLELEKEHCEKENGGKLKEERSVETM